MTTIYLVRHGEAEGNAFRRIHGQYDSMLTPTGFRQVEALKSVGLTVPETTELLWQLRQAGVDVPLDALSDEECAQALYRLMTE